MEAKKKDIIFWFDLVYILIAFIGYFLAPSKSDYVQVLALGIIPVLTALNIGISASIFREKTNVRKRT